jgi:hypothetical protein
MWPTTFRDAKAKVVGGWKNAGLTLIVSVVTHEHALQLSDRRRSSPEGWVDTDEKALVFCNHLTVAQAGVWHIEGVEALAWSMHKLADLGGPRDFPKRLPKVLDDAAAGSVTRSQFIWFAGCGWATDDQDALRGYLCSVSNVEVDIGEYEPTPTPLHYGLERFIAPSERVEVHIAHPSLDEKIVVRDSVQLRGRIGDLADISDPNAIARVMVEYAMRVAAKDDRVSGGFLISHLPRAAVGEVQALITVNLGPPQLHQDERGCLFIPPSGDTVIERHPWVVCAGARVAQSATFTSQEDLDADTARTSGKLTRADRLLRDLDSRDE